MKLEKLGLKDLSDSDVSEILIHFIAFHGLKSQVGKDGLSVYLIKSKIPSIQWRAVLSVFIGMPWILSKLDDDDYILLKQIHEMLAV